MERSPAAPLRKPLPTTAANGSPGKIVGEGLTYDDVLLVPAYSEVLPREVDIRSSFTRNIRLNIPVVSAAMDTVTGAELAIAIAQQARMADPGAGYDPLLGARMRAVLKLCHQRGIKIVSTVKWPHSRSDPGRRPRCRRISSPESAYGSPAPAPEHPACGARPS